MAWWKDFGPRIEHDAMIGRLTWFRLGGPARYLFRPGDEHQLAAMVARTREEEIPLKVLGAGANVLVSDDGFDGVVVRLDAPAFRQVNRSGDRFWVGAGVDLMPFSRDSSYQGRTGLECMAGIPGSVGGATRMNAGGPRGEFGHVVRSVRVVTRDGRVEQRRHSEVGFGYRRTRLDDAVVTCVEMELPEGDPQSGRRRYDRFMADKVGSQPLAEKSAGCIFKNPPGQTAGALIDQAGLKGASVGRASVSLHHANFIVARGSATASDVIALIELVKAGVLREFGIELELEVDVWRPTWSGSVVG